MPTYSENVMNLHDYDAVTNVMAALEDTLDREPSAVGRRRLGLVRDEERLWNKAIKNFPAYQEKIEALRYAMLTARTYFSQNRIAMEREAISREPFLPSSWVPEGAMDRKTRALLGNILLVRVFNPDANEEDKEYGWRFRMSKEEDAMKNELGVESFHYPRISLRQVVEAVLIGKLKLKSKASTQSISPLR